MTPTVRLTPRQQAIAALVARRQSGPEIAAELKIDVRTVYSHITAITEKLRSAGLEGRGGVWLIRRWAKEHAA